MCEWDKIELEYENFSIEDKSEILWLKKQFNQTSLDEDINWNKLSDKEKQIKRIIRSKIIKKSIHYDIDFFRYEESIIDLYEAINSCLKTVDDCNFNNLTVVRLKAHLCLIKKTINRFKDTRQVKNLFLKELKTVIYYCLNGDMEMYFIEEVNILYLESKLEILLRMINKEI
jgi:hypothetical protein